jgi:hypothetical protein
MAHTLTNTPTPDPAKRPAKPASQPIHLVPRPQLRSTGLPTATSSSAWILVVALALLLGILLAIWMLSKAVSS